MTNHSPFRYFKPGPRFLNHLAQAHGPGTKNQGLADSRPRTVDLPMALPEPNRHCLVLLGPRSVDQVTHA
jgi:hypothetical protein